MTLDDAIATLYAREINRGCETFWDGSGPPGHSRTAPPILGNMSRCFHSPPAFEVA